MLAAGAPTSLPLPDTFRFRLPEITFSENFTLHAGDHTFEIIGMPGHTACQTVVYFPEERVLFAGDTIANRKVPSLHEALPFEWLDSLRKLQKLDCEIVVPGHGNLGGPALIATYRAYFELATRRVDELRAAALSEAAIVDRVGAELLELHPDWQNRNWATKTVEDLTWPARA